MIAGCRQKKQDLTWLPVSFQPILEELVPLFVESNDGGEG